MTDASARLSAALTDRYRVERELGQGGMATVYLAEDLKHHRQVAIKVLRPELAASMGPERFLREIEIAAQLQHPHILPLLDSGDSGGFLFYVMPYVHGESLRDRLVRERELPVHDALRILIEVADALAHAHERGVVHRDIKPENILLSGRHALVADFGVAKAVSEASGRLQLTSVGVALGTPTYMAPEQASADPGLDHRVDIYALGVVAYELLAGRPPFTGSTAQEVLAAHMTRAPEPIRTFRGSVAPAVETIVLRCLEKHPADRWQTTAELVAQLEPLATPSGGMTPTQTRPIDAVAPVRTRRFSVILGGAALIGVAAAVVYALTRPPPPLSVGRRTQVTLTEGIEERPIISADGKSVAYGAVDPNDGSVRLEMRRVEGGSAVRLAAGAFPLGWSPGGDQILIATQRGLEIIPALGGTGKLIAVRSRSGAWSPDGKSIVFVQGDSLLARPIGPGEPRLVTRTLDPHSPAWSPDGKWIAFVSGNSAYLKDWNIATSSLWLAPASGGAAVPLTTVTALHLSPIWTPDSRRILFVSDRDRGRDVYELSLAAAGRPRGEPIRLTTGLDASSISLSADGRYLAYSVAKNRSNVGSVPVPSVGWVSSRIAQSVTSGDQNVESFDISRDGRWLVFDSDRSGLQQLFRMPLGGGEVEQITDDSLPGFSPSLSGDGKELAFHSISRDGLRRVFIKPVEGGRAVQVSPGAARDERAPYLSPEGSRILWEVPDIHGEQMATRGADGRWSGPKLVAGSGIAPAWSPDGTRFVAIDTLGNFAVNSVAGGPSSILVSASDARDLGRASWSSDGATLYLLWYKNQSLRVYAMPATGGTPREVVRFDDPSHPFVKFGFMEHAGRLYFTVGDQQSDIWVVELKGAEK